MFISTTLKAIIACTVLGIFFTVFSQNSSSEAHLSIQADQQEELKTESQQQQTAMPAQQGTLVSWISKTMEQSNSLIIRLLMVFLLGLLMSLTPCIYPMIPITAGILQAQTSRSLFMSFLLALSYTFGIATTFATLGLLAAFAGQAMGQFMNHPAFILPMVTLLVYLALAMIGLYDMYIPRFMQPRDHRINHGSFISAFAFGTISGIVASPCLSPGLVCLLCIVTTLGSKLLGFILLFAFGVGLGIPLLIIGTFSSSLSLLPSAGMWMIEVKKIFGFLMLAMCLYFLNYITPWHTMGWIIVAFALIVGSIFFYYASKAYNKIWQAIYGGLGIFLIASAIFLGFKAFQYATTQECATHDAWQTNYACAYDQAQTQHKTMFVDIGAPSCSICTAIDKTLFASSKVRSFLAENTVPVKIDGSDPVNANILKQFKVLGFPTVLLLKTETQEVIKQWGPELYDVKPEQFIGELTQLIKTTK